MKRLAAVRLTTRLSGKRLAAMMTASALIGAAGCSALGRAAFKDPVVHLRSVSVRGLGITGGSLDVKLSVYNPNHYRLDATRVNYKVNLAGDKVTVASGTLDNKFTVQDNDSSEVTIPVNFSYNGVGAAGQSLLNNGVVDYHVLGDITVGASVGSFTVPYSTTGRFTTTGLAR
ncbi:MAG TPA: LEA type 2 family protein [Gemmatimonadaceae bacterium]|jgi:LEA14-like dessication related protein